MNWNDYEAVWKRQELPVGADADLATLKDTFETKRRKLAATLFARDLREAGVGFLVAAFFSWLWWHVGSVAWPVVFAIALILGVSGLFIRERFRTRRRRVGPDAPLLAKVEADVAELRHQRRLLLSLWSWYLAPLAAALVIVSATLARILVYRGPPGFLSTLWEHPAAFAWIIFYFAIVVPLCFWGTWTVNRRAVRKGIEPRLEELEQLHCDLTSSS